MLEGEYTKHQVLDISIEDETQRHGRDVSFYVDSLEFVNIEIGNTITIRTDEQGVEELREALHQVLLKIEDLRYERAEALHNKAEDEMVQAGTDAREKKKHQVRELSEQQRVDIWNPQDPVNW